MNREDFLAAGIILVSVWWLSGIGQSRVKIAFGEVGEVPEKEIEDIEAEVIDISTGNPVEDYFRTHPPQPDYNYPLPPLPA